MIDPPHRDDVPSYRVDRPASEGMTRWQRETLRALEDLGRDVVAGGHADKSPAELMRLAYAAARQPIEAEVRTRTGGNPPTGGRLY